ncbi:hypothetical protein [Chryseobacterium turcicum]|uniref:Uncharacterized protein n=1 Tax=Chryseobacterium turcicum TaxID=2898076 RepID=A0A9Q3V316_9FLAO|nr:hypothetical protein [Chryseobacterium turcicum]MCD1118683.1 hypothetical protein [Chryseobacterium turcicum]
MKRKSLFILLLISFNLYYSQRLLTSWSQQNIENYTKEMYDEAQKLSTSQLLEKNLNDQYWSEVFLTLNASVNNYTKDTDYQKALALQISNASETKLKGTSRLIIWDRIASGDILFEGKGLVLENDLFLVAGRANQILQNLTKKNFGYVSIHSTKEDVETLKNKWQNYLNNKPVDEYKPIELSKSKIPEISSLSAVKALIISLQPNSQKDQLTKNCLKRIYKLDEMPKEKGAHSYCNPDTSTFSYLAMLLGDEKFDETKNAAWYLKFWNDNQKQLIWNSEKGYYEVKK